MTHQQEINIHTYDEIRGNRGRIYIGGADEDDEAGVAVVLDLGELRHAPLLLGLPVRPAPAPAGLHHQRAPRWPRGGPCQLQPPRQEGPRAGLPGRQVPEPRRPQRYPSHHLHGCLCFVFCDCPSSVEGEKQWRGDEGKIASLSGCGKPEAGQVLTDMWAAQVYSVSESFCGCFSSTRLMLKKMQHLSQCDGVSPCLDATSR